MSRRLTTGLILLIVISSSSILLACGDKFLVSVRGTRFQRAAVARDPAAILIYTNPSSELPKVLASVSVDATLTKAGYRPTTVATLDEFDKALSHGGWDLVLVAMTDAPAVSNRLRGDVVPVVLPVALNSPASELKDIKKQYRVVLKGPAKSQSFLSAIDEALAQRPKTQAKSNRKI
jgi:hypothetical protein